MFSSVKKDHIYRVSETSSEVHIKKSLLAFAGICLEHKSSMKLVFALCSHCAAPSTCANTEDRSIQIYILFSKIS